MNKARVYNNEVLAGILEKKAPDDYCFIYDDEYLRNASMQSISLTLPKTKKVHNNKVLFPFFAGLLAEGINKDIQCRLLHIDEQDDFTRLLKTATTDTIGAIHIEQIKE